MKTMGNFWFPTQKQTRWSEDSQIAPNKEPATQNPVDCYEAFSPSTVTVSGMVFAPDDIRALLYFASPKEPDHD